MEAVGKDGQLYMRPVVIGGDDLTVVSRADLAIPFVREYLDSFEKKSEAEKTVGRLSACAGIAFVKSSYPFYYAYNLAETLCGIAKKDAKSREMTANDGEVPSCLMFHKVQSSFVEDYGVIKQKELTPTKGVSFCYGPYYLKEQKGRWTIDKLVSVAKELAKDGNNEVKTHVREWMTLIHDGEAKAQQKSERVKGLLAERFSDKYALYKSLAVDSRCVGDEKRYAAYDALALLTINTQNTQNDER